MRPALLRWLCLSLCYLAFAGSSSKAEVIAAVLAGALAAILSLGLRLYGERRLSLRGRWGAVLAHTALQLARDVVNVGVTLLRALLRGRAHRGEVVLDEESAGSVGRGIGHRALTALLVSLTPDGVALETGEEAIPVHRLSRRPGSAGARHRAR